MSAWHETITDKYVGNVANKYIQENPWTIFKAFPDVSVPQLSGVIATYTKADWMRVGTVDDYIVNGAVESVGDDFATGSESYVLKKYKFHDDVDIDRMQNYDSPFDAVRDATEYVVVKLGLIMAKVFKTGLMGTGIWGTDRNCTSVKWSTAATNVIKKILDECRYIQAVTGFRPNRMIMCQDVFDVLQYNETVIARMKTTSDQIVTKDLIARLFDLEQIEVLDAVETTAAKNATPTTADTDFMISGSALLFYAPSRPSIRMPSAGYNLIRKGKLGKVNTTRIPMPLKNDAIRIEGWVEAMPFVLATDLGTYLYNLV